MIVSTETAGDARRTCRASSSSAKSSAPECSATVPIAETSFCAAWPRTGGALRTSTRRPEPRVNEVGRGVELEDRFEDAAICNAFVEYTTNIAPTEPRCRLSVMLVVGSEICKVRGAMSFTVTHKVPSFLRGIIANVAVQHGAVPLNLKMPAPCHMFNCIVL